MDDFAVFILSHGRPDQVRTVAMLEKSGYTGRWYVVVDDEDPTIEAYRRRYGDRMLVFCKAASARATDAGDLSSDRRTVVYARNAGFGLARSLGLRYFLELDDDYREIVHRYQEGTKLFRVNAVDLDRLFAAMLAFLDASGAATVAFGQAGDLIGGTSKTSYWHRKLLRKAMNAFFLRADDEWRFLGRINEDVSTYTTLAHRGRLFFTTLYATVNQGATQRTPGGMTEVYRDGGTYAKSFYTVMMCPSAVHVSMMRTQNARIHHQINWNACAPKILREHYRKAGSSG